MAWTVGAALTHSGLQVTFLKEHHVMAECLQSGHAVLRARHALLQCAQQPVLLAFTSWQQGPASSVRPTVLC